MVYEWEQHKNVLYNLYIQERKSLEDIMHHMKDQHDFAPSKRAFQTQFRRWEFPSKQNPAHRNVDLVSRVKELWEANYTQRDMLKTLNDEGYQIKERELMRVRAKNRWLLRIPNGTKPAESTESFEAQLLSTSDETPHDDLPDEVQQKRKERHDQRQAESDERWASRKRRRRTRDYAGIAADPPGPPRFPSETTLAEGMDYLSLDKKQYRAVRTHFQKICEEENIIKKTTAGAEKWQAAKQRLIQELPHLAAVFSDQNNIQYKGLALDVICTDVTKRMRTVEKRMTILDSKNVLAVNPEQSRQIRDAFYAILRKNHFTSKLETGHDHWNDLKDQWIADSSLLQEILAAGDADPEHEKKKQALEVLCRDVMKRLRDDQKRKGLKSTVDVSNDSTSAVDAVDPLLTAEQPLGQLETAMQTMPMANFDDSDLQIDPSLLQTTDFVTEPVSPTAVYIRPHTNSHIHAKAKMWLATLTLKTVAELHTTICTKWPNAVIARIDGIEKDINGQEISYLIEEDEELDHVKDRKAIFSVLLNKS